MVLHAGERTWCAMRDARSPKGSSSCSKSMRNNAVRLVTVKLHGCPPRHDLHGDGGCPGRRGWPLALSVSHRTGGDDRCRGPAVPVFDIAVDAKHGLRRGLGEDASFDLGHGRCYQPQRRYTRIATSSSNAISQPAKRRSGAGTSPERPGLRPTRGKLGLGSRRRPGGAWRRRRRLARRPAAVGRALSAAPSAIRRSRCRNASISSGGNWGGVWVAMA